MKSLSTLVLLALFVTGPLAADEARRFVMTSFNVSAADIDRMNHGRVVTRTLPATDPREVATIGLIRLRTTPDLYVQRLVDIVNFKHDEAVLQIGVFGSPATLHDIAGLTLDESDIRSLRECRVGDCGLQLSAEGIGRFHREVDWRRSDAAQRANELMRQILVDYVGAYQRAGAAASMQYADRAEQINLTREFVSLGETELGERLPLSGLRQHLAGYPVTRAAGTSDVIYWSKEKVGRRTVVSVTHLAISRTTGPSPVEYAIASRQIYATHYFDASLGLTLLVPDRSVPSTTYLAYINRSRIDMFGGVFGGVIRKIVVSRARSTVSDQLERMQARLERETVSLPSK